MPVHSSHKTYQDCVNGFTVHRTRITSRFNKRSHNTKARFNRFRTKFKQTDTAVPQSLPRPQSGKKDRLPLSTYPVACQMAPLNDDETPTEKQSWITKIFSLKPAN